VISTLDTYNLGFTAYGLGASHACALASVYLRLGDWDLTKREAIDGNVFQQAKSTSISRLEREFRLRLQTLTGEQLNLLVENPAVARVPLALLAVFKRYTLIRDFAEHVLAEKVQVMDFELRPSDYASFIEDGNHYIRNCANDYETIRQKGLAFITYLEELERAGFELELDLY